MSPHTTFLWDFAFFLFICMGALPSYMHVCQISILSTEAREVRNKVPFLSVAMWVLGIQQVPGKARISSDFNCWAISPSHYLNCIQAINYYVAKYFHRLRNKFLIWSWKNVEFLLGDIPFSQTMTYLTVYKNSQEIIGQ